MMSPAWPGGIVVPFRPTRKYRTLGGVARVGVPRTRAMSMPLASSSESKHLEEPGDQSGSRKAVEGRMRTYENRDDPLRYFLQRPSIGRAPLAFANTPHCLPALLGRANPQLPTDLLVTFRKLKRLWSRREQDSQFRVSQRKLKCW